MRLNDPEVDVVSALAERHRELSELAGTAASPSRQAGASRDAVTSVTAAVREHLTAEDRLYSALHTISDDEGLHAEASRGRALAEQGTMLIAAAERRPSETTLRALVEWLNVHVAWANGKFGRALQAACTYEQLIALNQRFERAD